MAQPILKEETRWEAIENECVVDSDCKAYGFENLYVCDASVFPTALGVNPQLTVMALATITANKIIKNWQRIQDNVGRRRRRRGTMSEPSGATAKERGAQHQLAIILVPTLVAAVVVLTMVLLMSAFVS